MEIEVVKDTKLELEMIIHGENHSLCNVLRKYLMVTLLPVNLS